MQIPETFDRTQRDFYTGLLVEHDIHSPKAVAWFDGAQEARFQDLVKIIPGTSSPCSLLDVGCGLGDLSAYLAASGYGNVEYSGIDAIGDMVEAGMRKHPGIRLARMEFLTEEVPEVHDYLACSGAMNVRMFNSESLQRQYVARFISKLYSVSKRGASFNLLSITEKRRFRNDSHIYYADRREIQRICRGLCRGVEILYNAAISGFTVYMRKGGEPAMSRGGA